MRCDILILKNNDEKEEIFVMEKTLIVAKALYNMYYEQMGVLMDEMKMHKLMYFSQREALMQNNEPLFDGTFYGWKYGPVLNILSRNQLCLQHSG